MRSSVIASLEYYCSGSLLRLTNGSTRMEGLSGNGKRGSGVGKEREVETCNFALETGKESKEKGMNCALWDNSGSF